MFPVTNPNNAANTSKPSHAATAFADVTLNVISSKYARDKTGRCKPWEMNARVASRIVFRTRNLRTEASPSPPADMAGKEQQKLEHECSSSVNWGKHEKISDVAARLCAGALSQK